MSPTLLPARSQNDSRRCRSQARRPPLTTRPTSQAAPPAAQQNTGTVNGVVYGPYVPYTPPPATSVQLGSTPPTRQIKQPEVTDVLPTAKYTPGKTHKRTNAATRPEAAADLAARRRAAAAAAAAPGRASRPQRIIPRRRPSLCSMRRPLRRRSMRPIIRREPSTHREASTHKEQCRLRPEP